MDFDIKNVHCTVNAEKVVELDFGYFSNNLESLRKAVETGRTNRLVVYDRLNNVLSEKYERRFDCASGNFSLFYPMDSEMNRARY